MSAPRRILVVEDNSSTRKMLCLALRAEGYVVAEAPDAATAIEEATQEPPDLILQDLLLPDLDGLELVKRLRALPRGHETPILALSGFLSRIEEMDSVEAGFTTFLAKPIEPSRLAEVVRAYLPLEEAEPKSDGSSHILLVDDDPVQLKLARLSFSLLGYDVTAVTTGSEAIDVARVRRPDVILSDVCMPSMDGFELCLQIRQDPAVADVPVILLSAHYRSEADRALASRVGASALVTRTPDFVEAKEAVQRALTDDSAVPSAQPSLETQLAHARAVVQQLERQIAATSGAVRRSAHQAAQLSLLAGVAEALTRETDPDAALAEVLASTLDAAGISKGAMLLLGGDGRLVLKHGIGFSGAEAEDLQGFFGEYARLEAIVEATEPLAVPSSDIEFDVATSLLARAGVATMQIVPLVREGKGVGAIVLAARRTDITGQDAVSFARAMGQMIVQSLDLADAFERLTRSELRNRMLLESARDAIAVLSSDGRILELNRRCADLLAPGGKPPVGELFASLLERDGVDVDPPFGRESDPVRIKRPDGGAAVIDFSYTELDIKGEPLILAVGRDVTEQAKVQEQLLVSDRMASVGMLAAGVAHEINNPLAAVIANLELAVGDLETLAKQIGSRGPLRDLDADIIDALEASNRVRHIVRDLRTFSRSNEDVKAPVDLHQVLDSALRMGWNEIRHRAQVNKEYASLPKVVANESRLGQVFLNLVVNAAQAIPEGRADRHVITISTRYDADAKMAVVEVRDTGAGMSPEVVRHLFTPFFTTKPVGVGTGLGLSICHRIVTGLGGSITVDSALGKGSVFRVFLPADGTSADFAKSQAPSRTSAPPRRGKVLIIDDDVMVGKIVRRMLSVDHDVLLVASSAEGLKRVVGGERFDVILCDVMMPVMTGVELFEELTKLAPEQAKRVIFLTGGAFTTSTRAFLDEVENPCLEKPFELEVVKALINDRIA